MRDDESLLRLHAEGWSDVDIAYIMGYDRKAIAQHRREHGLQPAPQKRARGWKHSEEAKAKIAEARRCRWQDPEYRERMIPALRQATANSMVGRFRAPDRTSSEGRLYVKRRRVLGPEAARAALAP